jgi:hypothetical protein
MTKEQTFLCDGIAVQTSTLFGNSDSERKRLRGFRNPRWEGNRICSVENPLRLIHRDRFHEREWTGTPGEGRSQKGLVLSRIKSGILLNEIVLVVRHLV